jgi:hypothetical protein
MRGRKDRKGRKGMRGSAPDPAGGVPRAPERHAGVIGSEKESRELLR